METDVSRRGEGPAVVFVLVAPSRSWGGVKIN